MLFYVNICISTEDGIAKKLLIFFLKKYYYFQPIDYNTTLIFF